MQIPLFTRVLYSNKNVHWTKEEIAFNFNIGLIQTSFTKANDDICIHFKFSTLALFYPLRSVRSHPLFSIKPGLCSVSKF